MVTRVALWVVISAAEMAHLMMVAMALSVAQGSLRLDANSWASLAAGANEVPGDESSQGARFLRVPCSNVDFPCTDENPVYRLDTDLKTGSKRPAWPMIFHRGQAMCAAPPPRQPRRLRLTHAPHPLAPQAQSFVRRLARRGHLVHDLGEMDPDQFFEHCWQPMVLYVVFMAFWTPTEAAVPFRQVQGLAREGPEAASHALAR